MISKNEYEGDGCLDVCPEDSIRLKPIFNNSDLKVMLRWEFTAENVMRMNQYH
jgi:hypothetical protein